MRGVLGKNFIAEMVLAGMCAVVDIDFIVVILSQWSRESQVSFRAVVCKLEPTGVLEWVVLQQKEKNSLAFITFFLETGTKV